MSEKRFVIQFNKKNFIRMFDNEKNEVVTETKAVDLLNSLYDENEQLKWELDECANNKLYSRRELEKENEQLRKKCFELEKDYLIETNDEVDKALYLEDDLKKLAKDYGVDGE